ncbi:MAG: hypothetical protein A2Z94_02640 [Gallionellales bacterium GWA2_55_18]|nr:MAG: hypothetical protein A2Z94_02640 [Gallionellales bacterium GWA2_55_18]
MVSSGCLGKTGIRDVDGEEFLVGMLVKNHHVALGTLWQNLSPHEVSVDEKNPGPKLGFYVYQVVVLTWLQQD